jgi:hypothetical protein
MRAMRSMLLPLCASALMVPSIASAQKQLPAKFLGLSKLELTPAVTSGSADDLRTARFHKGHAAGDVRPAASSNAASLLAAAAISIPIVSGQRVVAAGESVSGFAGLTHFDQRVAGTGTYVDTQFSAEPPDQGLCVGNGFAMEAVNVALAVYSTAGTRVAGPTALNQFYHLAPEIIRTSPPVFGPFLSDPKCYYDPAARRWFLTVLEIDVDPATGNFGQHSSQLIAVSVSADPTGAYYLYSFDTTDGSGTEEGHPACPCFGDQPLIGADANGFYVSTNEFPIAAVPGFNGAQIYAMSKSALLAGTPPTVVHINTGTIPVPPADQVNGGIWYSIQPATSPEVATAAAGGVEYFLSALQFGPAPFDNRLAVWGLTNTASLNGEEPELRLRHTVISSESYGMSAATFATSQKPGPTPLRDLFGDVDPIEQLAANDDRMNQVVFAGGDLWSGVNTNVSVGGQTQQGIAWFAVRPSLSGDHLSAVVDRQGYVAVENEGVLFPSIGVNSQGRAVMSFTLVGPDYWPSAAYASVSSQARSVHIVAPGLGPDDGITGYPAFGFPSVARWGDYTAAVADEHGNIWFASEYIGQTCTLAVFLVDPTCGSTRTLLANWGTFIARLSAEE